MFEEADLVHRYTRADALRDGVLIDLSATAKETGIRYPVALTRAGLSRIERDDLERHAENLRYLFVQQAVVADLVVAPPQAAANYLLAQQLRHERP